MDIMNFADGCVQSDRFMSHNASNHSSLGGFMRVHVALVLMVLASALAGCTEEGREERYEEAIEEGRYSNTHSFYLLTSEGSPIIIDTCMSHGLSQDQFLVAPFLLLEPISGFDDEGKVDVDNPDSIAGSLVLFVWDDGDSDASRKSQVNNPTSTFNSTRAGRGRNIGFRLQILSNLFRNVLGPRRFHERSRRNFRQKDDSKDDCRP